MHFILHTYPSNSLLQAEKAYEALIKLDLAPRGFAFWDILDEGKISPQRPHEPVWMAAGLNRFLKVRENTDPTHENV